MPKNFENRIAPMRLQTECSLERVTGVAYRASHQRTKAARLYLPKCLSRSGQTSRDRLVREVAAR